MQANNLPFSTKSGFTLVELLVALGVGMYLVSLAFVSLTFISKAIKRNEMLVARNDAAQQMLLWSLANRTNPLSNQPNKTNAFLTTTANTDFATTMQRAFILSGTANLTAYVPATKNLTVANPVELFYNQPVMLWQTTSSSPINWLNGTVSKLYSPKNFEMIQLESAGAAPPTAPAVPSNWIVGGYEMLYAPQFKKLP